MKTIREQFEEIWPVPEGVFWDRDCGEYFTESHASGPMMNEHNARLDTFTRCQESMGPVLSLVEDVIAEIEASREYLRVGGWAVVPKNDLLDRAKELMEQYK